MMQKVASKAMKRSAGMCIPARGANPTPLSAKCPSPPITDPVPSNASE
jgi:hypothetical protein